jgi:hypothetical protein
MVHRLKIHSERLTMKEKKPQFLKMNASREENPPHREIACLHYRACLTLAAFKNFCLDCSLCAGVPDPDRMISAGNNDRAKMVPSLSSLQSTPA